MPLAAKKLFNGVSTKVRVEWSGNLALAVEQLIQQLDNQLGDRRLQRPEQNENQNGAQYTEQQDIVGNDIGNECEQRGTLPFTFFTFLKGAKLI